MLLLDVHIWALQWNIATFVLNRQCSDGHLEQSATLTLQATAFLPYEGGAAVGWYPLHCVNLITALRAIRHPLSNLRSWSYTLLFTVVMKITLQCFCFRLPKWKVHQNCTWSGCCNSAKHGLLWRMNVFSGVSVMWRSLAELLRWLQKVFIYPFR